ncbi:MAG TPA: hypothetical protein DDX19_07320 [Rhodopirellula baltica]|uniref:Uncharacterized protein n=1 Tax=Rhodopirellula baltica (strain DSM 10527 / NCIMB 13988 / SH1) TaxID=243090 RepID=Q7UQC3_RHOBA|nr:hypothetical protein RB6405 [Rhodopirellula baltica SH 1]HBE62543.1 hypothetical protein [Rhodopirellula baltica]
MYVSSAGVITRNKLLFGGQQGELVEAANEGVLLHTKAQRRVLGNSQEINNESFLCSGMLLIGHASAFNRECLTPKSTPLRSSELCKRTTEWNG